MLNPYEPPKEAGDDYPLLFRVRAGLRRALVAYREGLKKDGVTTGQHVRAWITLSVLTLFIMLLLLIGIAILVTRVQWFF